MRPFWMSAFLDFAAPEYDAGVAHWQRITGWRLSDPRGDQDEFASLLPPDGDDYLRLQRLAEGPSRIHLDLHVRHPRASATHVIGLGGSLVADRGYQVMRSPGGFTFCFVDHPASRRPQPTDWPGGHSSILDQICLDIPSERYERETQFWASVTGCGLRTSTSRPEFRYLVRPAAMPLRVLLQRLEEPTGMVGAHLDLASTDRDAETDRHLAAGAELVERMQHWTVLDSAGGRYCITDRPPPSPAAGA